MQKKIERAIRINLASYENEAIVISEAAAEIAALYERKVIGQRDGKITLQYATNKTTGVSFWHVWVEVNGHKFLVGTTSDPAMSGQRVRVIVEDIEKIDA